MQVKVMVTFRNMFCFVFCWNSINPLWNTSYFSLIFLNDRCNNNKQDALLFIQKITRRKFINWASWQENLSSGVCEQQRRRPACASAISALIVSLLESIISKLATIKISLVYLVSVADETCFVASRPNCETYARCTVSYFAYCLNCLFDLILSSHQQSFSYVGTGLPGLNQY